MTETKQIQLINKYYDCYDRTAESYIGMFPAKTDMQAIRLIEDSIKNAQSALHKHPEDYRLDYIMTVDQRTGIVLDNQVKKIIEVEELKNGQDEK